MARTSDGDDLVHQCLAVLQQTVGSLAQSLGRMGEERRRLRRLLELCAGHCARSKRSVASNGGETFRCEGAQAWSEKLEESHGCEEGEEREEEGTTKERGT